MQREMSSERQPGIRFTGVHLLRIVFAIRGGPREDVGELHYGPSFKVSRKISEDKRRLDLFLETDLFGGVPEEQKPPIEFNFVLHGQFEVAGEEHLSLEEFAEHQGPAHLFPYAREIIANITSRSPLPTLNLGPINVVALIERGDVDFQMGFEDKGAKTV